MKEDKQARGRQYIREGIQEQGEGELRKIAIYASIARVHTGKVLRDIVLQRGGLTGL